MVHSTVKLNIFSGLSRQKIGLPRRGRTSIRNWAQNIAVFLAWCLTLAVIGGSLFFLYAKSTLPDPESISYRQVKESTKIYDRTGEVVLYDIYDEERRTVVPYDKISDNVKKATVAVEDSSFYEHRGFDMRGIIRSLWYDITNLGGDLHGGSTITQQLVGNALVGRQKNLTRKVQELVLAVEIERRYTKDQILNMYLNQVPYGSNTYGVESASQMYFGVPATDLSIAQSAMLASLVQRPSYLSPYGLHWDELIARKDFVLSRMLQLGYLDQEQYDEAKKEDLESELKPKGTSISAPHFVLMVKDYVVQKYGTDMVQGGGLKIITTLDAELQKEAEELVAKYAEINKQKYRANNAALVAIDPKTGDVLSLVGSAKYEDIENQGNYNVITSPNRQPGSAFKPIAYAAAFEKGFPDNTVLWDLPTEFNPKCPADSSARKDPTGQDCYHPKNYDGQYEGAITMRQSLARSRNTTSVQTLYMAGIDNVIDLATKMGITTLGDRSRWGLSLVLGGAEIRPIDLASAYGVFANDGVYIPWGLIQSIESNDGTVLEERRAASSRVLKPQTARMVTDVLADNNARSAVFGVNNSLVVTGRQVAAKTGTTQENRDAWVVGYAPSIVTAVWTGNNNNSSMTAAGGGISAAGPLWNSFMSIALKDNPTDYFPGPDPVMVNKTMLNGLNVSDQFPGYHSILFYVDKDNPQGPIPSNPESDPQFYNWEWTVQTHAD